jgi:hypothetical protein
MIEIKTQDGAGGKPRTLAEALAGVDREPLFSIDDVQYTIPVAVPPALGLEAIERSRAMGAGADAWLAELMLGADGWKALRTCPDVDEDQMATILRVLRERALGPLERANG